jgi:transposase InsO family protein
MLCRAAGVSVSGYYAWCARGPSARAQQNAQLLGEIHRLHAESRGAYGAPMITAALRAEAQVVNRKRVARLMREAGLQGITRRRFRVTTRRDPVARGAPDLVHRQFTADRRDALWVADITYVPVTSGPCYLAVVLDVFSRRIVGWTIDTTLETSLVVTALDRALAQRRPRAVIHHSDHGAQYTSDPFQARCAAAGVRQSMGAVGSCYDNAVAESFFATLECELFARRRFHTLDDARRSIFEFIEGWYNTRRLHSTLHYRSPMMFEKDQATDRSVA